MVRRARSLVPALMVVLCLACGGTTGRQRPLADAVLDTEEAASTELQCSIQSPGSGQMMSNADATSRAVKILVVDPEKAPVSRLKVWFTIDSADGTASIPAGDGVLDKSGAVSQTIKLDGQVHDGQQEFTCHVQDVATSREASSQQPIIVDNTPPSITPKTGYAPVNNSNFIGDLKLGYVLGDGSGTGIASASITVSGTTLDNQPVAPETVWSFTMSGQAPGTIDTSKSPNIVVLTTTQLAARQLHEVQVDIRAQDVAGNVSGDPDTGLTTYRYQFTAEPVFNLGEHAVLPANATIVAGLGQGVSEPPKPDLLVVGGAKGVRVLGRTGPGQLVDQVDSKKKSIIDVTAAVSAIRVVDMDLDKDHLPDVVVATQLDSAKGCLVMDPATKKPKAAPACVHIFLQRAGPAFVDAVQIPLPSLVTAMDVGLLNGDEFPDIALALVATDGMTLGLSMSLKDAASGAASWGQVIPDGLYGGVPNPSTVAIGKFDDVITGEQAKVREILVTQPDSRVLTVYPVDPATGVPSGGQNTVPSQTSLQPLDPMPSAISAVVTTNLPKPDQGGDVAVMVDASLHALFAFEWTHGSGSPTQRAIAVVYPGLTTGLNPKAVVAGDIDGDKVTDVAVLAAGSAMVQVFWGNRTSTLDPGPSLLTDDQPVALALADVDADGHPDLIVLDHGGDQMSLFPYVATRRFSANAMVPIFGTLTSLAPGNFAVAKTANTGRDLAVLQAAEGKQYVWVLPRDSTWGLPVGRKWATNELAVKNVTGLVVGDLDANGYDDLVLPSSSAAPQGTEPTVGTLLFKGGKSPPDGTNMFSMGTSPTLLALGDFDYGRGTLDCPDCSSSSCNKVGWLDIIVVAEFATKATPPAPATEYRLQTFVGNNKGNCFTATAGKGAHAPWVSQDNRPSSLAGARLSPHNYTDLLLANGASGDFIAFFNTGSQGVFNPLPPSGGSGGVNTPIARMAVGKNPRAIAATVLQPDPSITNQAPDVVTLTDTDIVITPAGTVAAASDSVTYDTVILLDHGTLPWNPADFVLADMNGDKLPDIVVLNRATHSVYVFLNLGDLRFQVPSTADRNLVLTTGMDPTHLVVADMDGDGCPDVATLDAGGQSVTLLRNSLCATTAVGP